MQTTSKNQKVIEPVWHIQANEYDEWTCICGNTADNEGFYPCDDSGAYVNPTPVEWSIPLYVCDQCGWIIDQDTLAMVGQRSDNNLTSKE